MTRQQIEAVLRKHLHINGISMSQLRTQRLSDVLDDLLALAPTPSREELEQIIQEVSNNRFGSGNPNIITVPNPVLVQRIMAWTQGTPPEPRWCTHIRWYRSGWYYEGKVGESFGIWVTDSWTLCPICQAPRPERRDG